MNFFQRADQLQRASDLDRLEPKILLSDQLYRYEEALKLIFEGLRQHYIECITTGRLDAWMRAAHASINLLGSVPDIEFVKRETLDLLKAASESRQMTGLFRSLSPEQQDAALAYRGPENHGDPAEGVK